MSTPQREFELAQALAAERAGLKTLFALPAGERAAAAVTQKSPATHQRARADATARGQ